MSLNVRALVNDAFLSAGVLNSNTGRGVEGIDANQGVIICNEVLGQLNVEELFPFQMSIVEFVIPTLKFNWTIGLSTADIAAIRPSFINQIYFQYNTNASPVRVTQIPISEILNYKAVNASGSPIYFAYNPKMPNGEIMFNIRPFASGTISIMYTTAIPQVTINDTLDIPLEYNELIKYAIARKVAQYKQMPLDVVNSIDVLYKDARSRVGTLNSRGKVPVLDDTGRTNITQNNVLTGAT